MGRHWDTPRHHAATRMGTWARISQVEHEMPVRNCTFVGCEFYALGFTGNDALIEQLLAIPTA